MTKSKVIELRDTQASCVFSVDADCVSLTPRFSDVPGLLSCRGWLRSSSFNTQLKEGVNEIGTGER